MISLSLPTVDNGTYMIEIVKDDGTAYVNLPITRGMVWNIIQPYTKESIKNIRKNSDSIKKYAISRINSIRASLGRNLLLSDDFLSKIAQAKVDDMIARKYV